MAFVTTFQKIVRLPTSNILQRAFEAALMLLKLGIMRYACPKISTPSLDVAFEGEPSELRSDFSYPTGHRSGIFLLQHNR